MNELTWAEFPISGPSSPFRATARFTYRARLAISLTCGLARAHDQTPCARAYASYCSLLWLVGPTIHFPPPRAHCANDWWGRCAGLSSSPTTDSAQQTTPILAVVCTPRQISTTCDLPNPRVHKGRVAATRFENAEGDRVLGAGEFTAVRV